LLIGFKIKRNSSGQISRYKARLVAQGFSQQLGTDFDEIFSPVVHYDSLRLLIALSCHLQWIPDQLDIKGAFLYGYLKDIYMKPSEGYEKAGYYAKLNRSIYGLKQSPKAWYERLTTFLISLGFTVTVFDPCVLIHSKHQLFVAIYVDDITLFGPPGSHQEALKKVLKSEFQLTDIGALHWLLGL